MPISAAAYFFLALVTKLQGWTFTNLPHGLGFHGEPLWWPVPPLVLAGILVALSVSICWVVKARSRRRAGSGLAYLDTGPG